MTRQILKTVAIKNNYIDNLFPVQKKKEYLTVTHLDYMSFHQILVIKTLHLYVGVIIAERIAVNREKIKNHFTHILVSTQKGKVKFKKLPFLCCIIVKLWICIDAFILTDYIKIKLAFKGCVCYIFASLFGVSKREHLQNNEKCFLISFQKLFSSWDNFKFSDIQISWHHQMPKYETRNTFYWIT